MAKPIGTTPTLKGEDAREFLKRMKKPPSEKDREFKRKLNKLGSQRRVRFLS
ncbi:hypothetical protein MBCUT_17190 [Methanobrevibacter cuticularis]|uniref:Uncharacterized protein n=1 Tax=Methanobrevibacter cuticularis TaxID=47311 RepID=A0A166CKU5_9EURY|nr:hypothetical protein [Methanobrevibacter cuticularis]KZX15117.1 hypothetical protein MBCUT_17190 [Methanobrevibacter cuticularis]